MNIQGHEVKVSNVFPFGQTIGYEYTCYEFEGFLVKKWVSSATDGTEYDPSDWVIVWLWWGYRDVARFPTLAECATWIEAHQGNEAALKAAYEACRDARIKGDSA